MSPNRIVSLILVLALLTVMAECFYIRVEKASAHRADPPNFPIGCLDEPASQQLLYHSSLKSPDVNPENISSKHFAYHRDVKSCFPKYI